MKITVCRVTDLGTKKKINQDASYAATIETKYFNNTFGIVCDGVGGCEHSEIASRFAVSAMSDWFIKCYPEFADMTDEDKFCSLLYERWFALFEAVNSYIVNFARLNEIRLGSTFTCILIRGSFYYILHIGDTRVYSINSSIKQLTVDHTVTQRELDKGLLTPMEARSDSRRHTLYKCLGMKEYIRPEFYTGSIEGCTKFLICSDGFRDKITDDAIADRLGREIILKKDKLNKAIKKVIKDDRSAGERDNISALVIQLSED